MTHFSPHISSTDTALATSFENGNREVLVAVITCAEGLKINFSEAALSNILVILVEAAGIEPASGNLQRKASTCLFRVLILVRYGPLGKGPRRPAC